MGTPGCVVGSRVDHVVGPDHERHIGELELGIDLIHLFQLLVGNVGLGEQDVHVPGHPAGDRVDRVLDLDATFLQLVGQLPGGMLRLRDRPGRPRER